MRILAALFLFALSLSGQGTMTCTGCTSYRPTPEMSMSYGARMVWSGTVEPGVYRVDLTFREPTYTTAGQRPLNVWVNDVPMLAGFDVFAAGGLGGQVTRSVVAVAVDEKIRIVLTASSTVVAGKVQEHTAILSGIAIAPVLLIQAKYPAGCSTPLGYTDPALCNPAPDGFLPVAGIGFRDQTFGSNVKILTTGYHTYSTPTPLSANNKYILIYRPDGGWNVHRVVDGSVVARNVEANESYWWDAGNDDVYYFVYGSRVIKRNVFANSSSVLVDYAPTMTALERGGTGDSSADNWISFFDRTAHRVCALDTVAVQTACADYTLSPGPPIPRIDFSLISKGIDSVSGKRYVIVNGSPSNIVYTVGAGQLDFAFRGPLLPDGRRFWFGSHCDTMQDSAGIQYVVFNDYQDNPGDFTTYTVALNKGVRLYDLAADGGGRTAAFVIWKPGPFWKDEHVGCAKRAPYCIISTQGAPTIPHGGEIILMKGNGEKITRLSKSHTSNSWYWGTPRAALSNDASLVVWDADFSGSAVYTVIATIP